MGASLVEKISIIAGVVTIIGGITQFIRYLGNKAKKDPPEVIPTAPSEQAIYLNKPKNLLKDKCFGRDDLLKNVNKAIRDEAPVSFVGNHVSIVGREGIGKTLFCQTLFNYYLKNSKIYIGWIECDGGRSIYEIIKESFTDSRFKVKSKAVLLKTVEDLDRPCVLFIDQVDQHTSLDEIRELIICPNTSIVISGLLKNIGFIDNDKHFNLERLPNEIAREIFEFKSGEKCELMSFADKQNVKTIINEYVKGNPFLAAAFARAKAQNQNSWSNVLKNMYRQEYYGDGENDDYIIKILKQLYKIRNLEGEEKNTLSKLCIFSSCNYTESVFEFSNIPMGCISRLCMTHWLSQNDNIFFHIDEVHRDALRKVLVYSENLKEVLVSVANYIDNWKTNEDKGFNQISPYIEDILSKVKRYTPQFMADPDLFARFAYLIADKYHFATKNSEKSLEWLGYCNPIGVILPEEKIFHIYKKLRESHGSLVIPSNTSELSDYFSKTSSSYSEIKQSLLESLKKGDIPNFRLELIYDKAVLEFQVKTSLLNSSVESFEVDQAYFVALSAAKKFHDFNEKQKYLKEEYCVFLDSMERYDEVKSLCKEHFDAFGFKLNDAYSCDLYHRYLSAAYKSDDENLIESLICDEIIDTLWNNSDLSITVAWSFGCLYQVFSIKGINEMAELFKRRMVILINQQECFWHPDIRNYIELSDKEFIDYMHSHDELLDSLNEALNRGDAEALYLEGRYQEKNGKFNEAFSLYEQSAKKDNLKGICSLALMYYRGPEYYIGLEEPQNLTKAREYWDYCTEEEREHRGSHYWLGIMLLDEKYEGYNKELAIHHLIKAKKMGSKGAIKKILELNLLT